MMQDQHARTSAADECSPVSRPRRLRRHHLLRDATADVILTPAQFICPLFVTAGDKPHAIASMPGVSQWPVAHAVDEIARLAELGVTQFILFGVPGATTKDARGSEALNPNNVVCQLLQRVRQAKLDVIMHADLCMCEYTSHGHCGVLESHDHSPSHRHDEELTVDNDATLPLLGQQAVNLAAAGADVIAPSGMMDNMVAAIRHALDAQGHHHTAILSYSVKYASSFYGPFRDAGQGGMTAGDRKGYQMDFRRSREWRTELALDLQQGADMVMVKPAATYLDVIAQVRSACDVPVAAYHVSGEYAMLCAAAEKGWLDLRAGALETTYAIRRAGADMIITYFAEKLAKWIREG